MALLDILKKKKGGQIKDGKVSSPKKKEDLKTLSAKKPREEKQEKLAHKDKTNMPSVQKFYSAHRVIKYPHVTEKSSSFGSLNKYAFVIYEKANKVQVKRAIEKLYGVRVLGVNVIHVPRKKRKLGRFTGWRGGYKKAVVTLREGHTIDLAQ